MKKFISVVLVIFILFASAIGSFAVDFKERYAVGDVVEFGSYPQSLVTDSELIAELNLLDLEWIDYGYYSGSNAVYYYMPNGSMYQNSYMFYADVTYNGENYRAVQFSKYRPYETSQIGLYCDEPHYYLNTTYQADSGYFINNVYWFKFEALEWIVIDPVQGLLLCKYCIDSQPFNNIAYPVGGYYYGNELMIGGNDDSYYLDVDKKIYANNWECSYIRQWLNDDFYNLAFSDNEEKYIKLSAVDNSIIYCTDNTVMTDTVPTKDYVYLLSYDEVNNVAYGFSDSENTFKGMLYSQPTDYAKCQGIHYDDVSYTTSGITGATSEGNCSYLLRTASNDSSLTGLNICNVDGSGYVYENGYSATKTSSGIRPLIKIDIQFENSCSHICHSENKFVKFIYKILVFFWELFNINQKCSGCQAFHY